MVDDYLLWRRRGVKKIPRLAEKLFFRGIVVCQKRENQKFVEQNELTQVLAGIKQANADFLRNFWKR